MEVIKVSASQPIPPAALPTLRALASRHASALDTAITSSHNGTESFSLFLTCSFSRQLRGPRAWLEASLSRGRHAPSPGPHGAPVPLFANFSMLTHRCASPQ